MKRELGTLHRKLESQRAEIERLRDERDKLKKRVKDLEEKLYPPETKVTVRSRVTPPNVSYFTRGS